MRGPSAPILKSKNVWIAGALALFGGAGALLLASPSGPPAGFRSSIVADPGAESACRILPMQACSFHELRFVEDTVQATMLADVDAGGHANTPIVWAVNGKAVGSGPILAPGHFRRGDRVEVLRGDEVLASTRISNAPPRVRSVVIRRDSSDPGHLRAIADTTDPDGDAVRTQYRWFVDGRLQKDVTGDRLPTAILKTGQQIRVEAIAHDGDQESVPLQSAALVLDNMPPILGPVGTPRVARDEEGRAWASVRLSASDPDADTLHFEAHSSWTQLQLDAATGTLRWPLEDGQEEFDVTVRVVDETGASVERTVRLRR